MSENVVGRGGFWALQAMLFVVRLPVLAAALACAALPLVTLVVLFSYNDDPFAGFLLMVLIPASFIGGPAGIAALYLFFRVYRGLVGYVDGDPTGLGAARSAGLVLAILLTVAPLALATNGMAYWAVVLWVFAGAEWFGWSYLRRLDAVAIPAPS